MFDTDTDTHAAIIDVNESNINDVLQKSVDTPVLLDFWADWCEPCKALAPILEKVVADYDGALILAKINADQCQGITQQLGVRGLPTLKLVVKGQLVDELTGQQPEAAIRAMLEPHLGPVPGAEGDDPFLQQIQRARAMGAWDEAIAALRSAIQEQPEHWAYHGELVQVLIDAEQLDEARAVADQIQDEALQKQAHCRLEWVDMLAEAPDLDTLQARLQSDSNDLEARYYYGLHLILAGHAEQGLDLLLGVMRADRTFREDGARTALLKAFDLLGADPAVTHYRRQMFALLH